MSPHTGMIIIQMWAETACFVLQEANCAGVHHPVHAPLLCCYISRLQGTATRSHHSCHHKAPVAASLYRTPCSRLPEQPFAMLTVHLRHPAFFKSAPPPAAERLEGLRCAVMRLLFASTSKKAQEWLLPNRMSALKRINLFINLRTRFESTVYWKWLWHRHKTEKQEGTHCRSQDGAPPLGCSLTCRDHDRFAINQEFQIHPLLHMRHLHLD